MTGIIRSFWGLLIVFLLSFWAIQPLFAPGFFPIHDDTQVVRVHQMQQALRDGHFPVRWVKDLGYGYGYPLFNFYAPLPYYVGGVVNLLGADVLTSTKMMMVIGILLSGVFMYFLAREFWGEAGGVVSGLFYMYAPYHAVDIYVRGAVGEFWAYAFIPLLFYGLWKIFKEQRWRWAIIGALGLAGVILSHNLTATMITPFIIIAILLYCYIVYRKKDISSMKYYVLSIFLGLGLSAFYWLPALLEMRYTDILSQIGGGADFRDHFVCIEQLWNSLWGFGGSVPGCVDGLSFKIGKLHLLLSLAVFILLVLSLMFGKKYHFNDIYHYSGRIKTWAIFSAIFGLLFSVFLMLEISKPVWEILPPMAYIQYPWRFLIFAIFTTSFLAGAIIWFFNKLLKFDSSMYQTAMVPLGSGVLVLLLLIFNIKLFQPQAIISKTTTSDTTEENIKWTTSRISDEYMPKGFIKPKRKEDVAWRRIEAGEVIIDRTQELVVVVENEKEKIMGVNLAPFPAWKVFIDGESVDYLLQDSGLQVLISKGKHEVKFSFISTPVEQAANIISLISTLLISVLYLKSLRYEKANS